MAASGRRTGFSQFHIGKHKQLLRIVRKSDPPPRGADPPLAALKVLLVIPESSEIINRGPPPRILPPPRFLCYLQYPRKGQGAGLPALNGKTVRTRIPVSGISVRTEIPRSAKTIN